MLGMSNELALLLASALVGAWLALLFLGWTGGGLIHILPAAAIVLFVRLVRRNVSERGEDIGR